MSNYTIQVDWSGKNALADSNPNKVISGTDFNDEFTAAQTAINTKADTSSPALTGIPTAPTADVDTNTTQIATTQYVQTELTNHLLSIYPVDSIYTSVSSTNPSSLFGGTWSAFGEGKVLVGKASSGTFDTAGATGGAETHPLTEAELPSHTHTVSHTTIAERLYGGSDADRTRTDINGSASNETTSSTGSGTAHNNLQPYVVVYMWKRTA
jgi:hypothetical protein